MADFYKSLNNATDVVTTRTLLHEAIPLTGTIVSGTYSDENIKNFSHGMFQSVYDYPYLSSSANHIFDIAIGVSTKSNIYTSVTEQQSKKKNIYNQMAQVLMGYDATGSILQFDEDGNVLAGGSKLNDVFFLNFSRLLIKDEIKKGTFKLELGVKPAFDQKGELFSRRILISDYSGSDGYMVNSPIGEYGILYATGSTEESGRRVLSLALANDEVAQPPCGLLFYQAGVAVISGSVFNDESVGGILNHHTDVGGGSCIMQSGVSGSFQFITGSSISGSGDAIRNRIYNVQFNNTVELNSAIYYCRANHNEFNFSSNPTYLSSSKMRVKERSTDVPISYITTIGLYNDNNELMAVGKLSEPLKKSPDVEFTLRARLDY